MLTSADTFARYNSVLGQYIISYKSPSYLLTDIRRTKSRVHKINLVKKSKYLHDVEQSDISKLLHTIRHL